MSGKYMKLKKISIPVVSVVILASQLSGCSIMKSDELSKLMDKGENIELELAVPDYDVATPEKLEKIEWVQLDQLKTDKEFRQSFDDLFNITIVSEGNINGKTGCLFVDKDGDRNGNTTLKDAFFNFKFMSKYWEKEEVQNKLVELGNKLYTDVGDSDEYAVMGAINAYYNLLPDSENNKEFNPTQSLNRGQFYTLVYKSDTHVKKLSVNKKFMLGVGGDVNDTVFAYDVSKYGFLTFDSKSLNNDTFYSSISRAEAVYTIVNKYFKDQYMKVDSKDKAFEDTKNAGDIGTDYYLKYSKSDTQSILGFNVKPKDGVTEREAWQLFALKQMMGNTDNGLQEELYKAMVVAKDLDLIKGDESRWDEPISKSEAIELVINTNKALSKINGYTTDVEYGNMNETKFYNIATALGQDENGNAYGSGWSDVEEGMVPPDPNKLLRGNITLREAKIMLEADRKNYVAMGYSDKDVEEALEVIAKSMGTTMAEVNRLPAEVVSTGGNTGGNGNTGNTGGVTSGNSGSGNSNSGGTASGNSGNSGVNPQDKNGNGIEDFIEDNVVHADGYTPVDDIELYSN